MSTPTVPGVAARRALARWALRMLRREWRHHVLVVALLTVGTTAAVLATNAGYQTPRPPEAQYGTADHRIVAGVDDPDLLDSYLRAAEAHFGVIDVIGHRSVDLPGTTDSVELRSQRPNGPYAGAMVRLTSGRYPQAADEIALTDGAAALLGTPLLDGALPDDPAGVTVTLGGVERRVVGTVENPGDLADEFALEAPAAATPDRVTDRVTVLVGGSETRLRAFDPPQEPGRSFIATASSAREDQRVAGLFLLILSTVGMLLVGLVAAAGFVVIAQRRQRQLGMLAAIGATPRHIRTVMVVSGAVVGAASAAVGVTAGTVAWVASAPRFEGVAGHRIDRFDLQWWLVVAAGVLAVATATVASWWPARTVSRIPVVTALSARPARPAGGRRSALVAVVLAVAGVAALAVGVDPGRDTASAPLLIGGLVALVGAVLSATAPALGAVAARAGRLPVAPRMAIRDLARNRARSATALSAMTVGLAIAVSVVVIAAAAEDGAGEGNLSDRELIVWVGGARPDIYVPARTPAELADDRAAVDDLVAALGDATAVPLQVAVDPDIDERRGTDVVHPLVVVGRRVGENTIRDAGIAYLATDELLGRLGIDPDRIEPATVLLTSERDAPYLTGDVADSPYRRDPIPSDAVERIDAPARSSLPGSLLTPEGLDAGGWEAATAGWIVDSTQPITAEQLADARSAAADAGLTVESRDDQAGLAALRAGASVAGVLLALAILALTVGLLRTESAGETRTLTAVGAGTRVRRAVAATTAGVLAALAVLGGTTSAYLALVAGYWPEVDRLDNIPVAHLAAIALAVPLAATLGGWLLAGREPAIISRRPMD